MGSAKVSNVKPQLPMAEIQDKKSIKNILKKPFQTLFQKDKKKANQKHVNETKKEEKIIQPPPKVTPVATLMKNFQKLEIENKSLTPKNENEDELKNFTYKVIEHDGRCERVDSHSSEDSGFNEKDVAVAVDSEDDGEEGATDEDKDVVASLKNLQIDDKNNKKKKLQTVLVSRGPLRNKIGDFTNQIHPYTVTQHDTVDSHYRQIHQVHKSTFSGGQVIVNANIADNFSEIDRALTQVEINVQNFSQNTTQEQVDYWQIAQEFINEESLQKTNAETPDDILSDFIEVQNLQEFNTIENYAAKEVAEPNPIEEFTNTTHSNYENLDNIELISAYVQGESAVNDKTFIFPTPPRSENVPSPMSDSQASFYPSNSDYTLSPERSSPIYNSDYEKYQDIVQFDDQYPSCVIENLEKDADKPKLRERNASNSSMTMKQFKDMQKELSMSFSKKECCQINRKSCKEIFQEHMEKLKMEERKGLCVKVAQLDLKTAYGVLHHILLSLSKSSKPEDLQYVLFSLICERVLSQKPALFVEDFGLSLIKAAALRCFRRPLLTRYLVQCARAALRADAAHAAGKRHVFNEVDALGDNLLAACARAGDPCADVLAELVRRDPDHLPLFSADHANAEGYSALHVACREHSASSPRLHTVHVLLDHAAADLTKGDLKGGDTALHVAVNSATCDLRLVMVMFRHVDRKMWKQLAHAQNRSSVTPLEYARSASKSTTRQNYPLEVLDFLKKCR